MSAAQNFVAWLMSDPGDASHRFGKARLHARGFHRQVSCEFDEYACALRYTFGDGSTAFVRHKQHVDQHGEKGKRKAWCPPL